MSLKKDRSRLFVPHLVITDHISGKHLLSNLRCSFVDLRCSRVRITAFCRHFRNTIYISHSFQDPNGLVPALPSILAKRPHSRRLWPSLSRETRWCTKHASENCVLGATLLLWNLQSDANCPRCHAPVDCTHVLRCHSRGAGDIWSSNIQHLTNTLTSLQKLTILLTATLLADWRSDSVLMLDPSWPPPLCEVIGSQDGIGWKSFLEGLLSHLWIPYMANAYATQGIPISSKR